MASIICRGAPTTRCSSLPLAIVMEVTPRPHRTPPFVRRTESSPKKPTTYFIILGVPGPNNPRPHFQHIEACGFLISSTGTIVYPGIRRLTHEADCISTPITYKILSLVSSHVTLWRFAQHFEKVTSLCGAAIAQSV